MNDTQKQRSSPAHAWSAAIISGSIQPFPHGSGPFRPETPEQVRYVHERLRRLVLLIEYLGPAIDTEMGTAYKGYTSLQGYEAAWKALTTQPIPDPVLRRRGRQPIAPNHQSEQELARRCHAWEANHPQRVTLAGGIIGQDPKDDYQLIAWCLHYGYDPITHVRTKPPKRPEDIMALLERHNVLTHFDRGGLDYRGISPEKARLRRILTNYHFVARMVNQSVRFELLCETAETDPALAHALLRQWMKDVTMNED